MTAPQVLLVVGIVAYLGYVVSWLRRRRDGASALPPIEPLTSLDDLTPPLGSHHSPLFIAMGALSLAGIVAQRRGAII